MNTTDETARAEAAEPCEHHWVSHGQYSALIPWVIRCDLCGVFHIAEMERLARAHLAAQEPTDEEVGHAYAEWMNHSPILDLDARRINCSCGDRGFTPPGYEHHRLRAGLSAARAARRDEEKRDG